MQRPSALCSATDGKVAWVEVLAAARLYSRGGSTARVPPRGFPPSVARRQQKQAAARWGGDRRDGRQRPRGALSRSISLVRCGERNRESLNLPTGRPPTRPVSRT